MSGFKKMQRRLREEGWYVEWALPCCQTCAWSSIPFEHEVGPFMGQDVDLSKVLFNHEQDCEIECDYDEENDESVQCATPDEQNYSAFCFDGTPEGVKNLTAIIPIIEQCGCEIDWDGTGEQRPTISWAD